MKDSMKVLFISPFEDMRELVERAGADYPEIDITFLVGNEDTGRERAQGTYGASYDCIISRGHTASLIRRAVAVPVIDVRVAVGDILSSLGETDEIPDTVAAVGYSEVLSGVHLLGRYLPFRLAVRSFDDVSELPGIYASLLEEGVRTVVCDTISYEMASSFSGFDAHLLRSGEDSVRQALDQVMLLFRARGTSADENQLLRQLARLNSESDTAVFSESGALIYSSFQFRDAFLLDLFRERLPDFSSSDRFRFVRQQNSLMYRTTARRLQSSGNTYYAFFTARRPISSSGALRGITYRDGDSVRRDLEENLFGTVNLEPYWTRELSYAMQRNSPVLIFGEVGIGKNHLAELLYLRGGLSDSTFVTVDFPSMGRASWTFLTEREDSPLSDNGTTIFLKNIDALDEQHLRQLLSALTESSCAERNSLIISSSDRRELGKTQDLLDLVNQLSCISVHMLPLRQRPQMLEAAVDLLLRDMGTPGDERPVSASPEAMSMFLHYQWPQNFDQLIRVVRKAATLSEGGVITGDAAAETLGDEMFFAQGDTAISSNTFLDLTKPMQEICRDVARIVLEQNAGNQTRTARSLGISRTTLWRMLQDS